MPAEVLVADLTGTEEAGQKLRVAASVGEARKTEVALGGGFIVPARRRSTREPCRETGHVEAGNDGVAVPVVQDVGGSSIRIGEVLVEFEAACGGVSEYDAGIAFAPCYVFAIQVLQ